MKKIIIIAAIITLFSSCAYENEGVSVNPNQAPFPSEEEKNILTQVNEIYTKRFANKQIGDTLNFCGKIWVAEKIISYDTPFLSGTPGIIFAPATSRIDMGIIEQLVKEKCQSIKVREMGWAYETNCEQYKGKKIPHFLTYYFGYDYFYSLTNNMPLFHKIWGDHLFVTSFETMDNHYQKIIKYAKNAIAEEKAKIDDEYTEYSLN